MNIERALISVYDKTGIEHLASYLNNNGVDIISTGGTYEYLKKFGIKVQSVQEYTGIDEIFDGRIKTISTRIAGGILADRSKSEHIDQMITANIPVIDMIVVNLCPFKKFSRETFDEFELIDKIDIGGINLIRSAAKNYREVLPIVDPADYKKIIDSFDFCGDVPLQNRRKFALKAFYSTMKYEESVHEALSFLFAEEKFQHITLEKLDDFKYGDNPHQEAYLSKIAGKESLFENVKFILKRHFTLRSYRQIFNGISFLNNISSGGFTILINLLPVFFSALEDDIAYLKLIEDDLKTKLNDNAAFISKGEINLEIANYILQMGITVVVAADYSSDALALLKGSDIKLMVEISDFERPFVNSIFLENEVLIQKKDDIEDFGGINKIYEPKGFTGKHKDDLMLLMQLIRIFETNCMLRIKDRRIHSVSSGLLDPQECLEIALSRFKGLSEKVKGGIVGFDTLPELEIIERTYKAWENEYLIIPKTEDKLEALLDFVKENKICLYQFQRRHFS